MTIRTRLWLSHIIALIIPLLTTAIILSIFLGGLYTYINRGNYIYPESFSQFNTANQIATAMTLRDLRHQESLHRAPMVYHLFDPTATYLSIQKGDMTISTYGNKTLKNTVSPILLSTARHHYDSSFSDNSLFFSTTNHVIQGEIYTITTISIKPVGVDNKKIQLFFKILAFTTFIILLMSIWFISNFLTRFAMRHIMHPISALGYAAKAVESGNLNHVITYASNDEFQPITTQFNAMIGTLAHNKKERELQEKSRRELIAGISHDLRTPLTSIKAYVQALLDGIASNEDMRQRYLHTIESKTSDIDRLLEQLFLFSKLDLGAQAMHVEKMHLNEFIHQYIQENKELFLTKGLEFKEDLCDNVNIDADASIFLRIIENIFTNSVKYKQKNIASVTVTLKRKDNNAILTICDDGPGVDEEHLPRLFEVFYRTDKSRANTAEGSGLGLAIVAKYIELMGGTITAFNNHPGLGITITLPLSK